MSYSWFAVVTWIFGFWVKFTSVLDATCVWFSGCCICEAAVWFGLWGSWPRLQGLLALKDKIISEAAHRNKFYTEIMDNYQRRFEDTLSKEIQQGTSNLVEIYIHIYVSNLSVGSIAKLLLFHNVNPTSQPPVHGNLFAFPWGAWMPIGCGCCNNDGLTACIW